MKPNSPELINEINHYLKRLFPICRSITGDGNRETLQILQEIAPLEIKEYPSGTPVYDWVIPDEWQVRDAWIKDAKGNKLVDFTKSNIHLVSYSEPVNREISFADLEPHLFYHHKLPEAIPYRTSYYKRDWGFCVTQAQYTALSEAPEPFEVVIDSQFKPDGSLTIGELIIPGKSAQEILISTYICHPSLANDNLSGMVMTAFLARELMSNKFKYSFRLLFVPETIGAIAYCAHNELAMRNIHCGFVVTTVGGSGKVGYRQSWDGNHYLNTIVENVFGDNALDDYEIYPFDIHGSDERQYSSQFFRINTVSITKDKYYNYDYYHTSLDDLNFISAKYIHDVMLLHIDAIERIGKVIVYKNLLPKGEVMLGKHSLYPKSGGGQLPSYGAKTELDLILWILFYCDGRKPLQQLSSLLTVPLDHLVEIAERLTEKNILERIL
jgi:aminopeptidase-like protein